MFRLFEYLSTNRTIVVSGFLAAGTLQSIDVGSPVMQEDKQLTSESDDDSDDESEEERNCEQDWVNASDLIESKYDT